MTWLYDYQSSSNKFILPTIETEAIIINYIKDRVGISIKS